MKLTPARLRMVTDALLRVLPLVEPADVTLRHFFREHHQLGVQDRAFVAETVWLALRRRRTLEHLCGTAPTPRRMTLATLAKFGGFSLRELEALTETAEQQWLQEMKAAAPLSGAAARDLPDWLDQRLADGRDEADLDRLARALNQQAPLDLRVNSLKGTRKAALAQLQESGIAAEPTPLSPFGIRVDARTPINRHVLFQNGAIEVQDEGSQLVALLVEPRRNDLVVDFCAGAGGKTLALGMLMHGHGRLRAFDVSEKRLANFKPRLARSGLSNVQASLINHEADRRLDRLAGKADRVLVDAPCTGLGTLRRNPDLKWRQRPEDILELTALQARILAHAARLVKPGGRLVYATCSLLDEENNAIVDAFLANTADFSRLDAYAVLRRHGIDLSGQGDLALSPDQHATDGFYAAVLERKGI